MASVRQTKSGKWELALRHADFPKGRRYFTFDTEAAAVAYGESFDRMIAGGVQPPQELLRAPEDTRTLGGVLRAWANNPRIAPTEVPLVQLLLGEIGATRVTAATDEWAEAWVDSMKTGKIAPSTIRKRVGALQRALQGSRLPKLELPRGYSLYHNGARHDTVRERRLEPGEHERILAAASKDMAVLYQLIVRTGLRLKEAYTLRVNQVDLVRRLIAPQTSKQWRGKVVHRQVPIRPELLPVLQEQCRGKLPSALLFPFWDGVEAHPKVSARLSEAFARLFKAAGCVGLREHDLRHEACASWLELKAADGQWVIRLEELNRIMGWSTTSTMSQRYANFRSEDVARRLYQAAGM